VTDLWFWLVTASVAAYAVLDGFDLGAGALHPWLARSERDRRDVFAAIGPVWDGNEVFLIASGTTLFLAFPVLYASVFSGLYLPLMVVLWLLVGRGIAVEFRQHASSVVWRRFWDGIFFLSSLLLLLAFGAATGNLLRGAPIDRDGRFFAPLWTDFDTRGPVGLLDWYTVLVATLVLAATSMHGATWLAGKTRGALSDRCRTVAGRTWWAVAALTVGVTVATFSVQPNVGVRLRAAPVGAVFPALAAGGLVATLVFLRRRRDGLAFAGSSLYLVAMLCNAAFGLYPYVLPSNEDPARGLTAQAAAAGADGLKTALAWWIPGMALAVGWVGYVYLRFRGRVGDESPSEPSRSVVP
jgi:cytochrome bd ubiquinol oxidase subunit II